VYFCWGTNDFGSSATGAWPNVANGGVKTSGQSFSTNLTGLIYGLRYWYRAYATNSAGGAWSDATNFLTTAAGAVATGGTVTNYTENGTNFTAHIFTNTAASTSLVFTVGGDIEVLVVGGGGGGLGSDDGGDGGGGGGAGGLIYGVVGLTPGSYTVNVGAGGAGGVLEGDAGKGSNSVFGTLTALGGGGATRGEADPVTANSGGSGGGGVGRGESGGSATQPGSSSAGYGNAGGKGNGTSALDGGGGGGGGGAGAAGTNSATKANGGNGGGGRSYSLASGTSMNYAGGGGGGVHSNGTTAGTATHGGGNGGAVQTVGASATENTGGGGGGGGGGGSVYSSGGNGGSGIVIVRYAAGGGSLGIGITNTAATGVAATNATLNATLTGSNVYWEVWAYWGQTDGTNNAAVWTNSAYVGAFTLTNSTTSSNIAYTATSGIAANQTYWYTLRATNACTNIWASPSTNFITGALTVQATDDTAQYPTNTGQFTIYRPATCTNGALTVYYAMTGTADNGVDYTMLSSNVTMTAGATSTVVTVTPVYDEEAASETAILTLTTGAYLIGSPSNATVTIQERRRVPTTFVFR
jgi:hypothetical protein